MEGCKHLLGCVPHGAVGDLQISFRPLKRTSDELNHSHVSASQ